MESKKENLKPTTLINGLYLAGCVDSYENIMLNTLNTYGRVTSEAVYDMHTKRISILIEEEGKNISSKEQKVELSDLKNRFESIRSKFESGVNNK